VFSFQSFACLKYSQTIKSLEIVSSILTSDCVFAISLFMPQLLELRLLFVRFMGNSYESIISVKRMKHVKRLTLAATPELTDSSLIEILEICTNLECVDLSFCAEITTITILAAITRVMKAPNKTFRLRVDSRFSSFVKTVSVILGKNILKIFDIL